MDQTLVFRNKKLLQKSLLVAGGKRKVLHGLMPVRVITRELTISGLYLFFLSVFRCLSLNGSQDAVRTDVFFNDTDEVVRYILASILIYYYTLSSFVWYS